jgi:hypothetical protein
MDKVNRKNSRAVLMLNKYKNINTEAKMELKLKLCFKNDLIRFIGNKLDKISKLFNCLFFNKGNGSFRWKIKQHISFIKHFKSIK